jgi:hypothetical protein
MNKLKARLKANGANDSATICMAEKLTAMQTDNWIQQLYLQYKANPQIKWKESIKKVVGIVIPAEKGLDV